MAQVLQPLSDRGNHARLWLAATGVAAILPMLANVLTLAANASKPANAPIDGSEMGLGLSLAIVWGVWAYLGAFAVSVVMFCRWLRRAAENAMLLGADLPSPGMTVGHFFIPFVHLYKPYQSMREIWHRSGSDQPFPGMQPEAPGYMRAWWGFWVASNLIGNISTRMEWRAKTIGDTTVTSALGIIDGLAMIAAAWFATRVVKEITERQESRRTMPPPLPAVTAETTPQ